jgi:hypothetical protein
MTVKKKVKKKAVKKAVAKKRSHKKKVAALPPPTGQSVVKTPGAGAVAVHGAAPQTAASGA